MLDRNNTGLMLIDVQGKLAHLVDQSEALIQNCERLVQGANLLNLPVVWVEQEPDKLGATVPSIASHLSGLSPILKHSFDACRQPAVMEAIEQAGCEHWLVCGIEAHICVYQTVQHLVDLDYGIQLVTDAVASRSATNKQLAIQKLSAAGVELTSVEMALYELMQDSRIPEFKQILDLIK